MCIFIVLRPWRIARFACTAIMQTQRNLRATEQGTGRDCKALAPSLAPTQLPGLRQARLHFRSSVDVKWCTRSPARPHPLPGSAPPPSSTPTPGDFIILAPIFPKWVWRAKKVNMYYVGNKVCIV